MMTTIAATSATGARVLIFAPMSAPAALVFAAQRAELLGLDVAQLAVLD